MTRRFASFRPVLLLFAIFLIAPTGSGCRTPAAGRGTATPSPPGATGSSLEIPYEPDPGPAGERPLDPMFDVLAREAGPGAWLRVLVDFRRQVDVTELGRRLTASGAPRSEARRVTLGALAATSEETRAVFEPWIEARFLAGEAEYYRFLRFRNRLFVTATPALVAALREHPLVAEVIPEYDSVRAAKRRKAGAGIGSPPIPPGDSWGVDFLGLRPLWDAGIDGRGVVVGILDTGVMGGHRAFAGRQARPGWYDPVEADPTPHDTGPHGSHVLACAVGGDVEGRTLGAAPGASWVAALANVFNSYNNVNMSLAADWLLFEGRPDVVLGAWGHGKGSCDERDRPMVEAFRAAGSVVVFAAGNDGPDPGSGQTPATLTGLFPDGGGPLSVAAVDRHGRIIDASSRGPRPCGDRTVPFPDVAAPGWELPVPAGGRPISLRLSSGTSMAVGWVGGVVALMLQVAPEMPVPTVERIVRETARDLPPAGADPASGFGVVDPAAAVAAARAWSER